MKMRTLIAQWHTMLFVIPTSEQAGNGLWYCMCPPQRCRKWDEPAERRTWNCRTEKIYDRRDRDTDEAKQQIYLQFKGNKMKRWQREYKRFFTIETGLIAYVKRTQWHFHWHLRYSCFFFLIFGFFFLLHFCTIHLRPFDKSAWSVWKTKIRTRIRCLPIHQSWVSMSIEYSLRKTIGFVCRFPITDFKGISRNSFPSDRVFCLETRSRNQKKNKIIIILNWPDLATVAALCNVHKS